MRHGRTVNHLGRTASHRKAMLANMACSLIEHKRINTTVAKAKALRRYVEPLITKSKDDSTHSRRTVFAYLKSKNAVTELFREVAPKVADRPGGYVRIIRTGFRPGDNAETAMIELVDFNTIYGKEVAKAAGKKRTRRGAAKKKAEGAEETSNEETAPKAKATRKKKADDSAAESSES
jgi:large subunit ribosomal protein L17